MIVAQKLDILESLVSCVSINTVSKQCVSYLIVIFRNYEGESISNQPIPFPIDRDGHDFQALFQYMFYTLYKIIFNKVLNVKHGHAFHLKLSSVQ